MLTLGVVSRRAMRICALAYGLKKHGIGRGDKVCVICPNVPMILDCIQALPAIHAVIVAMNIRLTKPEVDYILEHSGSKMIIVDSDFKHLAEGFKGEVIICNDSAGKDPNDPYEKLIEEGQQEAQTVGWKGLPLIDDENGDLGICYTSGTTGRPKGVLTTFRGSYLAGLANVFHAEMTSNSVYLWILPAFHAVGWTYPFAITAASAGQVCLRSVGDYTPIWESFLRDGVTVSFLMPISHKRVPQLSNPTRSPATCLDILRCTHRSNCNLQPSQSQEARSKDSNNDSRSSTISHLNRRIRKVEYSRKSRLWSDRDIWTCNCLRHITRMGSIG